MFQHQGSHLLLDNLLPFSKMRFAIIRTYPGEVKVLQQGLSSGGNGLLWKAQDERGEDPAWNVWNKSDVEKWKWKTQEILEDGRAWKMSQTLKVNVRKWKPIKRNKREDGKLSKLTWENFLFRIQTYQGERMDLAGRLMGRNRSWALLGDKEYGTLVQWYQKDTIFNSVTKLNLSKCWIKNCGWPKCGSMRYRY